MFNSDEHTFVVLAYKESPYIEETIISLRNQTVKSNLLIATSTPSDFLIDLAKKYNIPISINKNHSGIASDWSFAYEIAKTQYVTLAHQDDIYLPQYTEFCLNALDKNPGSILIFTDYSEMFADQIIAFNLNLFIKRVLLFVYLFKYNIYSEFLKKFSLAFGCTISCPTVIYNKNVIGKFNFANDFCVSLDWEAWVRLAKIKGCFLYVNKRLMLHRIHQFSQTTLQIGNNNREQEDRFIFAKIWPTLLARVFNKLYSLSLKSNKK